MGLGGGMVLIIYLTIFTAADQLSAQGINLIFFIPIAALALIIHTKSRLVEWKKIVPSIIVGAVSVFGGSLLADKIGSDKLRKLYAVFIILIGIKELFSKKTPPSEKTTAR